MATRPCFRPRLDRIGVNEIPFDFPYHAGFSAAQKRRNVEELHAAIRFRFPAAKTLEISSKSLEPLGVSLSAFNLTLSVGGVETSVETAFQSSKRFEGGIGPFPERLGQDSREVRRAVQEASVGRMLAGFRLAGADWPLVPRRAFYFHLYLSALAAHPELGDALLAYDGFTDIEFNPNKQLNCQADAAALYVSLRKAGAFESVMASRDSFLAACASGHFAD